jgi:hypothetical protein
MNQWRRNGYFPCDHVARDRPRQQRRTALR